MLFDVYLLIRKRAVLRKTVAGWRFALAFLLTGEYYTIKQVKFQVNS